MIYRVSVYCHVSGHRGYTYFGSQKEAAKFEAEMRKAYDCDVKVTSAPTPVSKRSMLQLLQDWGSHNDNG